MSSTWIICLSNGFCIDVKSRLVEKLCSLFFFFFLFKTWTIYWRKKKRKKLNSIVLTLENSQVRQYIWEINFCVFLYFNRRHRCRLLVGFMTYAVIRNIYMKRKAIGVNETLFMYILKKVWKKENETSRFFFPFKSI